MSPASGGGVAVVLANHGNTSVNVTIDLSDIPGMGPPPPPLPQCNAQFPVDLNDTQCLGLNKSVGAGSEAACCAACDKSGSACETWQYLEKSNGYAQGCYIGLIEKCRASTDGWISRARGKGPVPPAPPSPPPKFIIYDIWQQTQLTGLYPKLTWPALASHDSAFFTVKSPLQ